MTPRSCLLVMGCAALAALAAPHAAASAAGAPAASTRVRATLDGAPPCDHVVVVVLENTAYDVARVQPWQSSFQAQGTSFSQSYAIGHPSQPNYLALWSGSTQGITNDNCLATGTFFSTENLGHACEAAGVTWRAYSENLPNAGALVCTWDAALYVRRHNPWTNFNNSNHLNERPYADLAVDITNRTLPRLSFIIPNNDDDGHDTDPATADTWLSNQMPPILDAIAGTPWMMIVTYDEDDHSSNNNILTAFRGTQVAPGVVSSTHITHYTVLRTICEALGVTPFAAAAAETSLRDIWLGDSVLSVPAPTRSRLTLSAPSPNPTRGSASAWLTLPAPANIEASIVDVRGRLVRRLDSGPRSGRVALYWDGRDEAGAEAAGGLYFLSVRAGSERLSERLVRLR
ncbi:MAG TPA: alkaline phosphatase family protein [Candidatus Saccharimonadaceae bacterium]|nr:alkaline phosphatase family protein [Candidatus Saccharimonadaceae bacterium]